MITKVVYARLFNLGNYENERLEVEVTVEGGDYALAFTVARDAVEAQHAQFQAEREAAARRQQEEWEAEHRRRAAEADAERERRRQERAAAESEDQPF